jgi:hypothetical protein
MDAIGRKPTFGLAAVAFAVLTFVAPVIVVTLGFRSGGPMDTEPGWGAIGVFLATFVIAFLAAGIASLGGVVSGLVALARRERSRWLGWIGLISCGSILAMLVAATLNSRS